MVVGFSNFNYSIISVKSPIILLINSCLDFLNNIMKKIGLLFFIAFLFFFFWQLFCKIVLIVEYPLFGSKTAEEWSINLPYSLCSIFGVVAAWRLYNK